MSTASGDGKNSEILPGKCYRRDSRRAVNMKLFNVPARTRVSSKISKRQLQKRAHTVLHFIAALSGYLSDSERSLLLSQVIRKDKCCFVSAAKNVGLTLQRRLSPLEGSQMMSLLHLSHLKMRAFRRILENTLVGNFLSSEAKI